MNSWSLNYAVTVYLSTQKNPVFFENNFRLHMKLDNSDKFQPPIIEQDGSIAILICSKICSKDRTFFREDQENLKHFSLCLGGIFAT